MAPTFTIIEALTFSDWRQHLFRTSRIAAILPGAKRLWSVKWSRKWAAETSVSFRLKLLDSRLVSGWPPPELYFQIYWPRWWLFTTSVDTITNTASGSSRKWHQWRDVECWGKGEDKWQLSGMSHCQWELSIWSVKWDSTLHVSFCVCSLYWCICVLLGGCLSLPTFYPW